MNPVRIPCENMKEIEKAIEKIGEDREKLTFGIDGAVVKVDNLKFREILGTTAKHQDGQLLINIHQKEKKQN